jgi:hypothetical protein
VRGFRAASTVLARSGSPSKDFAVIPADAGIQVDLDLELELTLSFPHE